MALLCALLLQRGVTRAMEALSRCGAADDAWDDWEGITDSEEIRECLGQIVITRRMVHEAAAAFKDAFIQVRTRKSTSAGACDAAPTCYHHSSDAAFKHAVFKFCFVCPSSASSASCCVLPVLQSIRSTLSVAKVQAAEVTHVVLMGGGSELPCVRQAIRYASACQCNCLMSSYSGTNIELRVVLA